MTIGPNHVWIAIAVVGALFFGSRLMAPASTPLDAETAAVVVGTGADAKVALIKRGACIARKDRLWVVADGFGECIVFVASGEDIRAETAVLFFDGDIPATMQENNEAEIARYQSRVQQLSATFGVPFVVVARPGVMGSSGNHVAGGFRAEAEIMNAAVDALRQRLGVRRLVLAGQSGGARIVAQLMVLGRPDIACTAMGSGAYGLPGYAGGGSVATNIFGEAPRRYLIPLQTVDGIHPSAGRRNFIVGDERDTRTPFAQQREWAEKLAAAGHHAVMLSASGSGDEHHGLSAVALQVAGQCAAGRSDAEIRQFVATQKAGGR